jgi:hypothetical protein
MMQALALPRWGHCMLHLRVHAAPHTTASRPDTAAECQVSVAMLQSLDSFRGVVHEDMALASALRAPAHHLLACQVAVYGTPFG